MAAWPLRPVPGTPSLLRPASIGRTDRTILEPYPGSSDSKNAQLEDAPEGSRRAPIGGFSVEPTVTVPPPPQHGTTEQANRPTYGQKKQWRLEILYSTPPKNALRMSHRSTGFESSLSYDVHATARILCTTRCLWQISLRSLNRRCRSPSVPNRWISSTRGHPLLRTIVSPT